MQMLIVAKRRFDIESLLAPVVGATIVLAWLATQRNA